MTFTTITFLVFYLLFFILYWMVAPRNRNLRNLLIIIGGYVFYGWWDWRFLFLLFFSSSVDFCSGLLIGNATTQNRKRLFLSISIIVNLGLLGFFKYCDFFISSFNDLLHGFGYTGDTKLLNIILPVGLSFYTFQSLSYAFDVYRGKLEPTKKVLDFFAFVAFFPQLVSGPIERAVHMLPQFATTKKFNYDFAVSGLRLMLWGFFKKMVIADTLSVLVNQFYKDPGSYDTVSAWIAIIAYGFQIYCDFSGYSDIAMGCARTLGFDIMQNFKTPYFSKTFTEFWTRWHISLSTWFRDYVFIPLGGNKVKFPRYLVNLFVTFFLSGLWHGANYGYVIWGVLHGLLLIVEKLVLKKWPRYNGNSILLFFLVMACWVPFRPVSLPVIGNAYGQLFGGNFNMANFILPFNAMYITFLVIFLFFLITDRWINKSDFNLRMVQVPRAIRWISYYVLLLCILLFGDFKNAPTFIYFQF